MPIDRTQPIIPTRKDPLHLLICLLLLVSLLAPESPARAYQSAEAAASFTLTETLPQGVADGAAVWADVDNDEDQDLLITGRGNNEAMTTQLLRNNGGTLSPEGSVGLPSLESSSLALADYDNDGDLDAAIAGQNGVNLTGEIGLAGVYNNNGSGFFTLAQSLTGVYRGSVDWGDYDLDGDMDLLVTGYQNGGSGFGAIYRNDAGVFTIDPSVNVPSVGDSHVLWGDYDADRDLDFSILGKTCETCTTRVAMVMQNNGSGYYWPIRLVQSGLWSGATAWIDADTDGDLDLIISGNAGPDSFNRIPTTLLFLYDVFDGLTLAPSANLPGMWQTTISVGDYDNDGDPDLLMNGVTASGNQTGIYTNDNGTFSKLAINLQHATGAAVSWGQLNSDGNLDFAISGVEDDNEVLSTFLYENSLAADNSLPSAPVLSAACWDTQETMILDWDDASDAQTSYKALTYSVRIGTASGLRDVASPPSAQNGYRRLSILDGSSTKSYRLLKKLPAGVYSWAVQAVDSQYGGSAFSSEGFFLTGTAIALDDEAWAASGETTLIPVLENDNTAYGSLEIHSVQDPHHAWATMSGNQMSYTPDQGWSGVETVEYYALSPSTGYCSRGVVTISTPGIYLNKTKVHEGLPVGTLVGTLTTTHPGAPETFAYSLVSGEGSADNASFTINGDSLLTAAVFDLDVQDSYSIRVQAAGSSGTLYTKVIVISVVAAALNPPIDIILSPSSIQENLVSNSTVGTFSCLDPDPDSWCTYKMVNGPGSEDNASFSINWYDLRTKAVFNYENKASYSIRIRATDNTGQYMEKAFSIAVINVSDSPPTDLLLSKNTILQGQPVNTVVGTFTPIDPDPADTFRYRLVTGAGSTDNASFNLSGKNLRTSAVFKYKVKNTYSIRVRVTDQTDRYLEKVFQINVLEQPENTIFFPFIQR